MKKYFTRGLIAGTVIGTAVGMMFPTKTSMGMSHRMFRNGRSFVRRASNMIEDVMDMW